MALVVEGKTLLTYSEYVLFPEDGKRHEIIRGVHYVTPSPITKHQRVSRWIQFQLFEQIELKGLGDVINAPMDVILSEIDILQPDLMVILRKNLPIVNPKNVRGAPDLVVEIMSPDDRWQDVREKLAEYFSIGVTWVWVVEPQNRKVLVFRAPTDVEEYDAEDILRGEGVLEGFAVKVAELFAE